MQTTLQLKVEKVVESETPTWLTGKRIIALTLVNLIYGLPFMRVGFFFEKSLFNQLLQDGILC